MNSGRIVIDCAEFDRGELRPLLRIGDGYAVFVNGTVQGPDHSCKAAYCTVDEAGQIEDVIYSVSAGDRELALVFLLSKIHGDRMALRGMSDKLLDDINVKEKLLVSTKEANAQLSERLREVERENALLRQRHGVGDTKLRRQQVEKDLDEAVNMLMAKKYFDVADEPVGFTTVCCSCGAAEGTPCASNCELNQLIERVMARKKGADANAEHD